MRKNLFLLAIMTIASTMVTSCGEKDKPGPKPDKAPRISIGTEKPNIAVGEEGTFTVTSTEEATKEITVTVASSKTDILTITDATVKIEPGKKSISGKFSAVKEGDAEITITTSTEGVELGTAKVAVKVIAKVAGNIILLAKSVNDGNEFIDFTGGVVPASSEGFVGFYFDTPDAMANNTWDDGGVWSHKMVWNGQEEDQKIKVSLDNYGCDVLGTLNEDGSMYIELKEEGFAITNDAPWIENTGRDPEKKGYNGATGYNCAPYIWTPDYTANAGKSGYIISKFSYSDSGNNIDFDFYRGWVEVSVAADGSVSVKNMAICIGNEEFKAGQTK